jgi:predicted dienelactone hydrolase
MRPLEILLSLTNLLAFLGLAIPRLHALHWPGYAAVFALLVAVAQTLAEGPRWQMIPAYALTITLFLIWLLGIVLPGGVHANRLISILGIGTGILVLITSIALPILLPAFHFPRPTGPYAIGTTTYHWVDTSRPELFTTDPNDHRELMAQVWYPAKSEPSAPRAPYIPDADAVTPALARLFHLPAFFLSHFKYVTTNAVASAPMADSKSSYPVLIFLTGLDGFRQSNTFQIEELVSHGYIVVGLDQPGAVAMVRFPDGRQIPGWSKDQIQPLIDQSLEPQPNAPTLHGKALPDGIIPYFAQDVSFTLDQLAGLNKADPNHILTGRLDLERDGTFGISLGAIVAGEASHRDTRIKASLMMDAPMTVDVVKAGLKQPAMWITRDAATMRLEHERAGGWSKKEIQQHQTTMREAYEELKGDGYFVEIPKIFHLNFTDFPYYSPITSQIGLTGPIDSQRGFDIVNAYSVAFFDKHLKSQPSPLLNGPSKQYPEVNFKTRRR